MYYLNQRQTLFTLALEWVFRGVPDATGVTLLGSVGAIYRSKFDKQPSKRGDTTLVEGDTYFSC